MKKLLIFAPFLAFTYASFGQTNTYGISLGVGKGMIINKALDGGASYNLNTSFFVGFQYTKKLTNRLHLMTNLNWYRGSVSITPASNPNIDRTPKKYDLQLIYLPLLVKVDVSKYFFINTGFIADIDITKEKHITNQSGVGAALGIGTEIPVNDKFAIQLNPYLNFHGLFLTDGDNFPERVLDSGVKLSFILKR